MWLPGGEGQEKYVELMEQRQSQSGIMEVRIGIVFRNVGRLRRRTNSTM